jgi:ubiquinone/menaquinone biosynthesis C-methylase UbiE
MLHRIFILLLRFAFHLLYNPLAFTYDWVSMFISRRRWRVWTRAAIPRLVGTRVLELAFGTGDLLLDLCAAGYVPIGVDLSAFMHRIARGKLRQARAHAALVCARAQALPFAGGAFDSIVMTFPSGFVYDPRALAEIHRLLADDGQLVWVDAGRLLPRDAWSRALNRALDAVGEGGMSFADFARDILARAGFESKVEVVQDDASVVMVATATRRQTE